MTPALLSHRALALALVAALASGLAAAPASARDAAASAVSPSALKQDDLIEGKHYINAAGRKVHSPAHTRSGRAPPGASAQCRDGAWSFSTHHRGTCSRHGGVARWL